MSSNPAASNIDPVGFKLVRDVLRSSESIASSDTKRDALLFLSAEFRSGVPNRTALRGSLANRKWSSAMANLELHPRGSAVDRWQDEGGR
ncbi:hypothetical protein EDF70_12021 [Neorhizobium sp. JUb45]|nr:hypothetical protein EDF70_12021 [Neorhizobium sp. JUb45]